MISKIMCGNRYKYDMIEEQFSLGNSELEDEHIAFVENVYEGVLSQGKSLGQFCRPLKTQPKAAPKDRQAPKIWKQYLRNIPISLK